MSLSYYIYISDAFTPADPRRILRLASHATTLFYRQRRHAKRALSPSRHVARRIASDGYDGNLRLWTLEKQSLRLVPGLVGEPVDDMMLCVIVSTETYTLHR